LCVFGSLRWFLVVHPRMFSPCFKSFSDLPFPMLFLHITIFLWFLQLQIITFFFSTMEYLKLSLLCNSFCFRCVANVNICICVFTSIVIQYNWWKTFDNLNVDFFLWPWEMLSFYINIWYFVILIFSWTRKLMNRWKLKVPHSIHISSWHTIISGWNTSKLLGKLFFNWWKNCDF